MKIRLWKIGSMEHGIYPDKDVINKARNIIKDMIDNPSSDGVADLVWGPELSVEIIDTGDVDAIEWVDAKTKEKITEVVEGLEENAE